MTKREYKEMYDVVGAAMEVFNTLGRGMAEAVYQEALAIEFQQRGMKAEREKMLTFHIKAFRCKRPILPTFIIEAFWWN